MFQIRNQILVPSLLMIARVLFLMLLVSIALTILCFIVVEKPDGASVIHFLMIWLWIVMALCPYYILALVLMGLVIYYWQLNNGVLYFIVSLVFFLIYILVFDLEWEFILANQIVVTCAYLYCIKEVKKLRNFHSI